MRKFTLNEKIINLKPYDPICGEYRIRLDANESFITPDDEMNKKIAETITASSINRYPDPYATDVCKLFAGYCGVSPENVVAGNGSDEIISILMASFFSRGDKIAVFAPDFSMYQFYAGLADMETVIIQKGEDMRIDIDTAVDRINAENIKGVILSNPCSPTSIGIPATQIIKLAQKTNALVVIDEAYMEFYHESVIGMLHEYENLVVLKTCSKAFGLAGIRLGFALAGEPVINALKAVKSPYNVSLLTQCAAKVILSDTEKIKQNIQTIKKARDFLYNGIKNMEGGQLLQVFPTDTNFVFVKARDSRQIYEEMKKNGIAIRLIGDYLRITAGTQEENTAFLDTLKKIVSTNL